MQSVMNLSTTQKDLSNSFLSIGTNSSQRLVLQQNNSAFKQAVDICENLRKKQGIHSTIAMKSAGFHYIYSGDTVRCDTCGLEVSGWTLDMKPFAVHAKYSPQCPYVLSILPRDLNLASTTINVSNTIPTVGDGENSNNHQTINVIQKNSESINFGEIDTLKQIRKRTFSHWPHRTIPSSAQMIEAGFFSCNVGDRVICLYCNLICQQWTPNTNDPYEIHRTFSPRCPYVMSMLKHQSIVAVSTINEYSSNDYALSVDTADSFYWNQISRKDACHSFYKDITSRHGSFSSWSGENLPPVDELVRAGFFYTGAKTIVTCFYCNGTLEDLKIDDNPMVEHARRFPKCVYVKQICGAELYRNIQQSNQNQEGYAVIYDNEDRTSYFIKARLDLHITKRLMVEGFDLSIIQKCYENQFRLTGDDFFSDSDLRISCIILQKQIQFIDEEQGNIIIPSIAMAKVHALQSTSLQNDENESI